VYDGCEGTQFADKRIQTVFLSKRQGKSMRSREDGKEHGQAGRVRNVGLKLCRTPWIGFVDDDDTLDENYVHFLFTRYAPIYNVVVWRMTYSNGKVLPPVGCQHLEAGLVGISFCFRNIFHIYFANNSGCEDFIFLRKLLQRTPRQRVVLTKEVMYYVGHEKPTEATSDTAAVTNVAQFAFAFTN
jgi:glycosyltransferase involved in cell wall biosynthesis